MIIDPASDDPNRLKLWLEPRSETTLRGRVIDGSSAPIPGVEVVACELVTDPAFRELEPVDPGLRTRSSRDGTFEFRGLWTHANYQIRAWRLKTSESSAVIEIGQLESGELATGESRELSDLTLRPQTGR